MNRRVSHRLSLLALTAVASSAAAQSQPEALIPQAPADPPSAIRSASDGSIINRKDARTITLKIPAPRGQIVDRQGKTFAQNEVAYQIALQYRQFEHADRDFVVQWARTRLDSLPSLVGNAVFKTDDELYDHYRNRRWLPLLVSGQLSEKQARELESKLSPGLILHPIYRRYYPHGELAAHLLGYVGSTGKLPTGPINFNEPLWEETEGRSGFEKIFERQLSGDPGMKRLLFDEAGNKLLEEQVKRPRPGGTLVSTLHLDWQRHAEEVLRKGARRGAFVVVDVTNGEVLVMASRPAFDPNRFTPGISDEDYRKLENDPSAPLHARAFQSRYPPASTFKPIVALAALDNGTITESSTIYSPVSLRIGNHTFRNWSSTPEGDINVRRALARSCNTWFYQVGINVGANSYLGLSRRLGMGERSGLPLIGETEGLVPSDEYMLQKHKRRILSGDTANMSIGQGDLLASPLQVAQAMAGIANGDILPKLSLVRQIQDTRGRVVQLVMPAQKRALNLDAGAVETVREGMRDVVGAGYGTGRSGNLSFTTLAGKTGTAQWGPPSLNQRLAWFAGFLPHDNPRYAFAVLYEGSPNETVSGGRMAAPMVRNFFEPLKDEIQDIIAPPKRALVVVDENADVPSAQPVPDLEPLPDGEPLRALPVDPLDPEAYETPLEPRPLPPQEPQQALPVEPQRALPVEEEEIPPPPPVDDQGEEP